MNLLREPLLHFLVIGALLFGAWALVNRGEAGTGSEETTIRITEREVSWLAEAWSRQWQREPTEADMRGLMTDYLREELLAREARALGLDDDDIVVRRRLAQKMSFIVEDTARIAEPAEAELRARFEAEQARFTTPPLASFQSVYFSPDRRGERATADARAALRRLAAGADPRTVGDGSLLPDEMRDADEREIAAAFGAEFAASVLALAPGRWLGPVTSSYGLHLVRVISRAEARPMTFEEARPMLADEWRREHERAAKAAYFSSLLDRYRVETTDATRGLTEPAQAALRSGE